MYKIFLFISIMLLISSCQTEKSNAEQIASNIEIHIKKTMDDPDSYKFSNMTIDTVWNIKPEILWREIDKKYFIKSLTPEAIKERGIANEKQIKKYEKYIENGTIQLEDVIRSMTTTDILRVDLENITLEIDSLRNILGLQGDSIKYYLVNFKFREKNKFNALILKEELISVNSDFTIKVKLDNDKGIEEEIPEIIIPPTKNN